MKRRALPLQLAGAAAITLLAALGGCAGGTVTSTRSSGWSSSSTSGGVTTSAPPYDYTAFQSTRPATLLVLPPASHGEDFRGKAGVWTHAVRPLAEAGYYVLPIALVNETLRQNGILFADEAHKVPPAR